MLIPWLTSLALLNCIFLFYFVFLTVNNVALAFWFLTILFIVFVAISPNSVMPLVSDPLGDALLLLIPIVVIPRRLDDLLLADDLELFGAGDHLALRDRPLPLLLARFLHPTLQVFNYHSAWVNATDNIFNIMILFKLNFRIWAFQKSASLVTKLPIFIITPHKESTIFKCDDAVFSPALNISNFEWFFGVLIYEATHILN